MAVSGVACRPGGVDEIYMSFESSFEGVQGARIVGESRYIVPGSPCRDYKGVSVEIRRRTRPMQCSSGARASVGVDACHTRG